MALAIAWAAVALVAALGWARAAAESLALRRLVAAARQPERLKKAVAGLPPPHRSVVSGFIDGTLRTTVDEALTRSLVQASQARFTSPPLAHAAGVVATVAATTAPAVLALVGTAERMVTLFADGRNQTARARYLAGADSLHPAFVELQRALEATGEVLAALALAWALRWWLVRPEVREARLVRAMIDCAGRMRPGANAPVATRLAELMAPPRGLRQPAIATATWTATVSAGWLLLLGAADLRADGDRHQPFDVWPPGTERRIEAYHDVVLPRADAGSPIVRSERPSLTFAPSVVYFHNLTLLTLDGGALTDDWTSNLPPMKGSLDDFARPLEVTVLGHRRTPMATMARVMTELARLHGIVRYHLIVERGVGIGGGQRLQATLPLELATADTVPSFSLRVLGDGVQLLPTRAFVPFDAGDWALDLRTLVRQRPSLTSDRGDPIVLVEVEADASYERLVEVLSAADGACLSLVDCGLPGLGLRFALKPPVARS